MAKDDFKTFAQATGHRGLLFTEMGDWMWNRFWNESQAVLDIFSLAYLLGIQLEMSRYQRAVCF